MDNYPDDPYRFSDDPRSPLFDGVTCKTCLDDTGLCDCLEIAQGEREAYEEASEL